MATAAWRRAPRHVRDRAPAARLRQPAAERRPGVLDRIEHRDLVARVLGRAVQRTIRVHGGIAAIARDQIVQILVLVSAQSRSVTTTLRSTPCGRGGVANGSSPFLMRSVQSAKFWMDSADRACASWPDHLLRRIVPTARGAPTPHATRQTCRAMLGSCAWTAGRAGGSRCSRCSSSDRSSAAGRSPPECRALAAKLARPRESSASSTSKWPGSSAPHPPASARHFAVMLSVRPGAVGIFALSTRP